MPATIEVSAETQKLLADFPNMFDQLQKGLESKNSETVRNVEAQFKKIQDGIDEHTKSWAKAQQEADNAKALAVKLEERLKGLETEVGGKGKSNDVDSRKSKTYNDFFEWMKKGDRAEIDFKAMATELAVTKSTLRTDSDVAGGYLVPQVMDGEIRKNIREVSPVRLFARNRNMASKTMEIPRRGEGITRAPFEGELETSDSGISKYVQETVTAYRQSWTVPASNDMLISSAFDLENEIISDVQESFADGEGYNFIHGTGVKGPKGIIADARCEVVSTETTGVLGFGDFATIAGKLKKGQRPAFFLNRTTLSEVWKLKGSDGHPIWMPVAAGGTTPATIFGFAYNSDMINLDDHVPTTSNTKPIIFGDLMRGYEIFDLAGMVVIRDDYTQKKKAIVEWTFHRYLTGQVILPEAIKILKIK
jgi:HK97 family phage major capsid protein